MSILFINGSPNKNGNTATLAAELLKDHEYETLNLTDYTIGAYGQNLPGDGLDAVIGAMKQAAPLSSARRSTGITSAAASATCWIVSTARWRTANCPDANCILCFRARLRKSGCSKPASTL